MAERQTLLAEAMELGIDPPRSIKTDALRDLVAETKAAIAAAAVEAPEANEEGGEEVTPLSGEEAILARLEAARAFAPPTFVAGGSAVNREQIPEAEVVAFNFLAPGQSQGTVSEEAWKAAMAAWDALTKNQRAGLKASYRKRVEGTIFTIAQKAAGTHKARGKVAETARKAAETRKTQEHADRMDRIADGIEELEVDDLDVVLPQ